MATANTDSAGNEADEAKKGSAKVAQLVSRNIEEKAKDARTCRINIKNFSKTPLTKPKPYTHCCRTIGDAPPMEIKSQGEGSVNFSKPRLMPLGCSGLLSYMFGRNSKIVILFRNPMIQLSKNSKSTVAVAVVSANQNVNEDLYKDMSYAWDHGSAGPRKYRPIGPFVKQRAADGQGELMLDDTTIKFVMTQDTNAVLSIELHQGGKRTSLPRGPKKQKSTTV